MRPEAPPRLLERVVCLFLPARDRETISGDLLILLVRNGRTILRTFVTAGAIGIVLLGSSALTQILRAQHFEGFVLLISIALILQGLLTFVVNWGRRMPADEMS